ncbi:glycosyltransferase family 4 protein [Bizionia paragorgiae]|uniref:Glycosyltransferase involved in cell wall bisynthesis n=1 Tax=Bizionia paragorgiae TaxID=283786 RepID=A0A1H4BBI2_BIZPA|nr:glycosyltransferase family 4 protein [Bizionia paragorgiae]SEA45510.1 Glycosyltransferase involved in cell wall bisynthesis [Bizionia paragorgiae]
MKSVKIIRTSTVAISLDVLLKGQLEFLNNHFEVIAVSGQDKHLENVKKREKVKTIAIEMQRNISPLKDIKSLIQLYRLFKKEKPEIVHSITPKAGLLSMLAAKYAGVPIRIHMFTGLIFPTKKGLMKKLLIQMDKLLCWAATDIIPEGYGVKQDLIGYNITKKPLNILANGNVNGIDVDYYNSTHYNTEQKQSLKKELNIQENDFLFIFVGRLVSDKGINELVQAFKELKSKETNAKLLLVGPLETALDPLNPETLQEIETNDAIISVGYQNDVRPYFSISDALVFPSYREGFPNVVLQAGAMGLPSIVSDINGCNEIIIEGENGVIIPSKDSHWTCNKKLDN